MIKTIEGITYDYRGDIFIDVGGNIGMWTTQLAPYFNTVFFIEPSEIAMNQAKNNIDKINSIKDKVIYIKKICSSVDGSFLSISSSGADSGNFTVHGSDLYEDKQIVMCEENIETMTLDSLIPVLTTNDNEIIIKIDTEGSELDVLIGAEQIIKKYKPVIVLETHYHMYYDKNKENYILSFLEALGYQIKKSKMINYLNTAGTIYANKYSGTEMYDLHYHMLLEPK